MSQVVEIMWAGTAVMVGSGADPGFFLGGGALVSCSTSTPINHIVFFLQNTSCIRKLQVIAGGGVGGWGVNTPCTLPLDPPLNGLREAKRREPKTFWVSQVQNIVNGEKEMK